MTALEHAMMHMQGEPRKLSVPIPYLYYWAWTKQAMTPGHKSTQSTGSGVAVLLIAPAKCLNLSFCSLCTSHHVCNSMLLWKNGSPISHQQVGIIRWRIWIPSDGPCPGPGLSNCASRRMLNEPAPFDAVREHGVTRQVFRDASAPFGLSSIQLIPDNIARCTARHPNLDFPSKGFVWQACQVSGRGVRWEGHAGHLLLSYQTKEVVEHFARGLPWTLDIIGLTGEVCLACMLSFRAGGVLGGPGQPVVSFTASRQT
eukprot:1154244-Pelagomonas_calceolata.AAC.2